MILPSLWAVFFALQTSPVYVITAARLIDGRSDAVLADAAVIVENGFISAAGPRSAIEIPTGAERIDLGDQTLLPGLIDGHTHTAGRSDSRLREGQRELWEQDNGIQMTRAVRHARLNLLSGITTARVAGDPAANDFFLRDAIEAGRVPGPRILPSGQWVLQLMLSILAVLTLASTAFAQKSKYEFGFGYEFLRDQEIEENFPLGWNATFAWNANPTLAIVGDVGGSYKSYDVLGVDVLNVNIHAFLAGPRFSKNAKVAPYGQVLAGFARAGGSALGVGLGSNTELAFQPGGGVDFYFTETFGARVGGDFRRIFGDAGTNEFRITAGVIVGFGGSLETIR